jgi:hypothetical protein
MSARLSSKKFSRTALVNGSFPGLSSKYYQELMGDKVELGAMVDSLGGRKTLSFTFVIGNGSQAAWRSGNSKEEYSIT